MSKVRVRFAPSPTGPLHIGGVRTALFNYLFAKSMDGDFILRIEDTDSKREVEDSDVYIMESLNWLGIMPDEFGGIPGVGKGKGKYGPYRQSDRKEIYKEHVDYLLEKGFAYYAFDTSEELDMARNSAKGWKYGYISRVSMKNSLHLPEEEVKRRLDNGDDYVVRFKMPRELDIKFNDIVRNNVVFNTADLDDKVIWKSKDSLPTYHLANVVDDHLMKISHVIRGEEWITSTPLHILLYEAFGWDVPIFCHLPLILGPDGKKLSKRHAQKYGFPLFPMDFDYTDEKGNAVHVEGFKDAGYEPDALINFLSLLGWTPKNNEEIMSLHRMVEIFNFDRLNSSGARFDKSKLDSFNAHYVRSKSTSWILDKMEVDYKNAFDEERLKVIAGLAIERSVFSSDIKGTVDFFFERPEIPDDVVVKNPEEFSKVMTFFTSSDFIEDFDERDWVANNIKKAIEDLSLFLGVKVGSIMPALRVALAGGKSGPDLPTIMYVLGKEESANRVIALLNKIKEAV